LSGFRVSDEDLAQHQLNLLHHLTVGQGRCSQSRNPRHHGHACERTGTGIFRRAEELIELLLAALNRGVLPEIPSEGSVGASGDLVPLAHMARLFIGLGHARVNGERLPATEALRKAGLAPLVLQCKEGLALVNGTSVMTGLAALATHEADRALRWMELLTACLFQVLGANPRRSASRRNGRAAFAANRSWPSASAIRCARTRISPAALTSISGACSPRRWIRARRSKTRIRCVARPKSSALSGSALARGTGREPRTQREHGQSLVFADTEMVIHCGNFDGQQIAMGSDYLRLGLIKLALLADRQIERLVNWRYSRGLPPLLAAGEPGLNTGFGGAQLLATSLAAEARLLGTPASIQTISTNANNRRSAWAAPRQDDAALPL
jgi:histidine ammonia-lyase